MTFNEKISLALLSALNHLNKSISALKRGDENAFSNDVWHVAAELEYALFLFSLMLGEGRSVPASKLNPDPKNLPTEAIMLRVRELIEEAQGFLKVGSLSNALRSTYLARHYLFKVQEGLSGKKHGVGRK
ncbi:MAG: hypothetical protein QXG58_06675 [Candidatus Bathyarchaeia archaeon]